MSVFALCGSRKGISLVTQHFRPNKIISLNTYLQLNKNRKSKNKNNLTFLIGLTEEELHDLDPTIEPIYIYEPENIKDEMIYDVSLPNLKLYNKFISINDVKKHC